MSSETASEQGLSRRALFGAGLGRLARDRLDRLELLEQLGGRPPAPPGGGDPDVELDRLRRELRATFDADDARPFLRRLEPAAERLVAAAEVPTGGTALDVGAGDGNVAAALARRGVAVEACDLSAAMVVRGRARTEAEGLDVEWREADVEALPHATGSFDAVLSSFGAVWAPRAERAVAELTRVCRPGGAIALTAWTPSGFIGRAIALGREAAGWPAKAQQPERWGRYETAYLHLFGLEDLRVVDATLPLELADDDELWRLLSSPSGPLGRALLARPDRAAELRTTLLELAAEHGRSGPGGCIVPGAYALLVGRRPLEDEPSPS